MIRMILCWMRIRLDCRRACISRRSSRLMLSRDERSHDRQNVGGNPELVISMCLRLDRTKLDFWYRCLNTQICLLAARINLSATLLPISTGIYAKHRCGSVHKRAYPAGARRMFYFRESRGPLYLFELNSGGLDGGRGGIVNDQVFSLCMIGGSRGR